MRAEISLRKASARMFIYLSLQKEIQRFDQEEEKQKNKASSQLPISSSATVLRCADRSCHADKSCFDDKR